MSLVTMSKAMTLMFLLVVPSEAEYDQDLVDAKVNSLRNMFLAPKDAVTVAGNKAILAELEQALGSEHRSFTERRLAKIEEALRPTYNAIPKNEKGLLGHSAVSYLLHRVFVLRHGWFVKGLDPEAKALSSFNTSSASAIVEDHIQHIFEHRIGGIGATLHETAILAATLEHLVHKEAMARLSVVYETHKFAPEDVLSEPESEEVLDTYMSLFILGFLLPRNSSTISPEQVEKLRDSIADVYPHWPHVQSFAREVKNSTMPARDYFYFADIANMVEEIGDRYGSWQDQECVALKDELIAMEDNNSEAGAGRIRLGEFYKKAMYENKFQFSESIDYLRQLGALDESDPENPKLLIVNYANSPSNCVASSNFYSVCCRNECEDLLGYLETQLAKPEAKPAEIVELVAALPSRTTPAAGTLPGWLLKRLDEVAAQHGGLVPLHSRLFMQWMHFAYPRECAYPHAAGMTAHIKVEDVVKDDDPERFIASDEDMLRQIELPMPNITTDVDAMWTSDEELIVWRGEEVVQHSARSSSIFFVGSVVSVSLMLVRMLQSSLDRSRDTSSSGAEKYYV